MIIDFSEIEPLNRYHLLTQTILPRPIAWVLSENENNSLNLAPFSFFNAMCSDPPLLVLSIGKKPDGQLKDTRRNLVSGREFVIHIANAEQAGSLNKTAAVLDYEQSEVDASNIPLADFPDCPLPRLLNSSVAFHCKFYDVHEIGPNQQAMIYTEVLQLYVSDDVIHIDNHRYRINSKQLNPLARLGGSEYSELGRVFSVTRPK